MKGTPINEMQILQMKHIVVTTFLAVALVCYVQPVKAADASLRTEHTATAERTRVYVLTDISSLEGGVGEPDDTQSLIRFLLYANEFEIEGLGATYSSHGDTIYPQHIRTILSAYGKSQEHLARHGAFPDEQELSGKIRSGSAKRGTEHIGPGNDSELSEHLIEVLKTNHKQPLWILVWGGSLDLAQALWKMRETLPQKESDEIVAAMRVYSIMDQYDNAGGWIRDNFKDLFFVLCNASFRGMYRTGDASLVSAEWVETNILSNPAPLAQMYPCYKGGDPWGAVAGIKEGDTPSFLYLLPSSPGEPENPLLDSWGGNFRQVKGTRHYVDGEKKDALSLAENISRWRADFQADFKERLSWLTK